MRVKENLIGQTFSYLEIIAESPSIRLPSGGLSSAWLCKCVCGKEIIRRTSDLKRHLNQSCGCKTPEFLRKFAPEIVSARKIWKANYSDGDLKFEEFLELTKLNCFYCGIEPSNIYSSNKEDKRFIFVYSGLDRIDSNKKHDSGNCVACCFICNRMKSNMSHEEFLLRIRKIYNNFPL